MYLKVIELCPDIQLKLFGSSLFPLHLDFKLCLAGQNSVQSRSKFIPLLRGIPLSIPPRALYSMRSGSFPDSGSFFS